MKTLGIIGGVGPESTSEYYRLLVDTYRDKKRDGSYPRLVINSVDLKTVVDMISAGQLAEVTDFLATELQKLVAAGVDFALIAANTPHIVFPDLQKRSPVPLLSIVEATCRAARARHLHRLALFGTRFTMGGRFYPDVFKPAGLKLAIPTPDEQTIIHDIYMNELIVGTFKPESRARLLGIVDRMKIRDQIDGLILGGTELPLLLKGHDHAGIQFLDTTRIHVEEAVAQLIA